MEVCATILPLNHLRNPSFEAEKGRGVRQSHSTDPNPAMFNDGMVVAMA